MMNPNFDLERLLTARQTRQFFGDASNMWLWRRLHDENDNFPQPVVISKRRFWRFGDLIRYRDGLAETAA